MVFLTSFLVGTANQQQGKQMPVLDWLLWKHQNNKVLSGIVVEFIAFFS